MFRSRIVIYRTYVYLENLLHLVAVGMQSILLQQLKVTGMYNLCQHFFTMFIIRLKEMYSG